MTRSFTAIASVVAKVTIGIALLASPPLSATIAAAAAPPSSAVAAAPSSPTAAPSPVAAPPPATLPSASVAPQSPPSSPPPSPGAPASAASTLPQTRVAFEDRLDDQPLALPAPAPASAEAPRARRMVRLAVDVSRIPMDERASNRFEPIEGRLEWYRARNIDVWLALEQLPLAARTTAPVSATAPGGSALTRYVRTLASRLGDHVRIVELALPRETADAAALAAIAFEMKTLAIELHGARPSLTVAIGAAPDVRTVGAQAAGGAAGAASVGVTAAGAPSADAASGVAPAGLALDAFYTADLAPYVDALVIGPTPDSSSSGGAAGVTAPPPARAVVAGNAAARAAETREDEAAATRVRDARALLDKVDPTARVLERGVALPAAASDAGRRFTEAALWRLGGGSTLTAFRAPTSDAVRAVARQADALRALLEGEITALDPRVATLTLSPLSPAVSSEDQTAASGPTPRAALVYNLTTFGTYLIYAAPAGQPRVLDVPHVAHAPDRPDAVGAAPGSVGVAAATAQSSGTQSSSAQSPGAQSSGAPSSGATVVAGATVRISLTIATPARPNVLDPETGTRQPAQQFVRDEAARRTTFVAPLRARPLVIDFNDAVEGVVTERSDVSGLAELSVEEIVARHQQRQAAQDAAVRRYTASVRMEQHFRPTAADAGYDVVTENRFFVDDESVEWEELSFSVNGAKWTANRPAFPLIQPEKVLSVPLRLRLTADYRYRLGGRATVDGHDCYVVHFDPLDATRSLYRGTVWIDVRTFARRRLQTVQTNLVAPIVSNEETHELIELPAPAATSAEQSSSSSAAASSASASASADATVLLPSKVSAKQILLIAGRNVLLEKITTFTHYQINGAQFAEQRTAARAGERIMYRDTDRGVRYLVKEGDGGARVVSEQMTARAKAMAMGVNIDPSYDFPLPILGINYLDFAFRGPDSQLAILFGGVLALGNIQRPKLFGTKLDGSVDFFAIAVPGNDRTYDGDGVRKQDELLTWPLSAGLNLGYQFTSFQKVTGQYQFQFNGYLKNRETTEDYHVPSSTVTNGVGLAYEYRRAGYSLVANGTWYGRLRWKPWGQAAALQATPRTYTKYSLNLSKDWYVGLFHKIHLNGAYFGGRDLDRFSQYQFGMFDDTRVHGVPAAGVRYGELAMARGSYSFNLFEQYRFDLFLEQVFARDPAAGASAVGVDPARPDRKPWDPITGVGVAFTVKAPFNTLLRADVGKAFLPDRYRATGSTVVSVLFLKPL